MGETEYKIRRFWKEERMKKKCHGGRWFQEEKVRIKTKEEKKIIDKNSGGGTFFLFDGGNWLNIQRYKDSTEKRRGTGYTNKWNDKEKICIKRQ